MIINQTSHKHSCNIKLLIMLIIMISVGLINTIMAQSEQGRLVGLVNFEKSVPGYNSDPEQEYLNDFFLNQNFNNQSVFNINDLNTLGIIGKEIAYEYDLFTVHMIISSDSTLHLQNTAEGTWVNTKSKTIHLDDYRMLTPWVESDNTIVTLFSNFRKGEASAFLFKDDGVITPLSGSIKIK